VKNIIAKDVIKVRFIGFATIAMLESAVRKKAGKIWRLDWEEFHSLNEDLLSREPNRHTIRDFMIPIYIPKDVI